MKSAQGETGQTGKYGTRGLTIGHWAYNSLHENVGVLLVSRKWVLNAGYPTEHRMQTPTALKPRESHLRADLALKESVRNRS